MNNCKSPLHATGREVSCNELRSHASYDTITSLIRHYKTASGLSTQVLTTKARAKGTPRTKEAVDAEVQHRNSRHNALHNARHAEKNRELYIEEVRVALRVHARVMERATAAPTALPRPANRR